MKVNTNNNYSEKGIIKYVNEKIILFLRELICITCLFTLSSINAQTWPPEGMQGDGTNENPWEITLPEHLATLSTYVNVGNGYNTIGKYYKLMNNIDLSEYANWEPIGARSNNSTCFSGNFNGNNKIVKNLTIRRSTENYIGLFGIILDVGSIENLSVEDCDVVAGYCVGGLVGMNHASICNCNVTGKIIGNGSGVGGLVGYNYDYISNCHATCDINNRGGDGSGGLVGYNYGNISNCHATGDINSWRGRPGGLVGLNFGNISNCHATGDIIGVSQGGGLIGLNLNASISNCYATGNVNCVQNYAGGLIGENMDANISNCYATGNVNGTDQIGGLVGCNQNTNIFNSYATGNVNANGSLGYIGGLVGHNLNKSTISYCYAKGNVIGNGGSIGGLVGYNISSTISYCYATGNASIISGNRDNVGGLVGDNAFSTIFNCYATGNASGNKENVGGLLGRNARNSIISYCYATGSVSGGNHVGGLLGINDWDNTIIRNCVAVNASVIATTNTTNVNRIAGNNRYGVCNNNYALNSMIVLSNGLPATLIDGLPETGIGKPIDIFQNFSFYHIANNWDTNAWDIGTEATPNKIWKICDSLSLPFFQWQEIDCEIFTINATAGSNGIINPFGKISVIKSTDRTFAFFADAGFKVESLLIDGVNKPEFIVAGTYTFKNITENHTIHVTFTPDVNIIENEQASNFTIYPNPSNGMLYIASVEIVPPQAITILDVLGRCMASVEIQLASLQQLITTLDISNLPSGIYFLRIQTKKNVIKKKIIKQ